MVKPTYKVGDKVFAKVKGYPPWPARIESDTGRKKYNVLFYGTKETGAIKIEDICYFTKNKESFVSKYLKRAGYEDAVNEIEAAIKKDGGDGSGAVSVDNSLNDIVLLDASNMSVNNSLSEKKASKRKIASLPDQIVVEKKSVGRLRRKSLVNTETKGSKQEQSEEATLKRLRRKSIASIEIDPNEEHEQPLKKFRKSDEKDLLEDDVDKKGTKNEKSHCTSEEAVGECEKSESENETNQKNIKENEKEKSQKKLKKGVEVNKKPKEPEFISFENNEDENLNFEDELASDAKTKDNTEKIVNNEIVTEQMLNSFILYAEHVKKHENIYKDKPIEPREDSENQVLPVKLPSGSFCGLKLHQSWPLKHKDENERALYDETVAKSLLALKEKLTSGEISVDDVRDIKIIPDIHMTSEDIKEVSYTKDIESKRKRVDRLKRETDLVTWDSKIKNNLGLDKALPDSALDCLKEFSNIAENLDSLMFKKHPHVLDTVRRLRKYVGNVKEWDMTEADLEVFLKKAERIRNEAEKVYNKIKQIVTVPNDQGTFWDGFLVLVSEFRTQCKDLSEAQVSVLCAEPDSRQAFLDKLDEESEPEGAAVNVSSASNNSEPVLKETSVQGWTEKK